MNRLRRSAAFFLTLTLAGPLPATEKSEGERLLDSGKLGDAERAVTIFEARATSAPDDYSTRLGAAYALNQVMAIRTNGNLPRVDGLQDSEANKALWSELGTRALEHARAAHALRPDSVEAAAALATSYMFYASSLGIISAILGGAGGEFRSNAQRVIDLQPDYEDGLGHTLLGSLMVVAPWPVRDREAALSHYESAAKLSPQSVRNQYLLGVYWARGGEPERARGYFERALSQPCTENSERLFCAFMKRETRRVLADLG